MQQSEHINELAGALNKAQAEFEGAAKDSTNNFLGNKYASLESIIVTVKPILAKYGLAVSQPSDFDEHGREFVETVLMHSSGQYIAGRMLLHAKDQAPQSAGSAITYCRRYALQAILNIPAVDDDAEAATVRSSKAGSESAKDLTSEIYKQYELKDKQPANTPQAEAPHAPRQPNLTPTGHQKASPYQQGKIQALLLKTGVSKTSAEMRLREQFKENDIAIETLDYGEAEWLIKKLQTHVARTTKNEI